MTPPCKKTRGYLSHRKKKRLGIGLKKYTQQQKLHKRTIIDNNKIEGTVSTKNVRSNGPRNHFGHSYCRDSEKLETSQIETSNSINEISQHSDSSSSFKSGECGSTQHSAPVRRKLIMEGVPCYKICDELPALEDIPAVTFDRSTVSDRNYNDGVPIPFCVTGRRIVDFESFFSQIKQIDTHNEMMGCSIRNCYVKSEIIYGLRSRYVLKCDMCNLEFVLCSEEFDRTNSMDVNTASVAGSMAIGIGHSQLQELLSSMEIPTMSATTYSIYHDKLAKAWEETALDEMKSAALDEITHAVANGQVTSDGTPILTVVADGSWAKRSYRTNYNSLSGVAAIVGFHTKKVIFIGVRNKYCTICARAVKTEEPPSKHACFKNWAGSSSGMETDIILEGFSRSMEMYGAVYGKVLADGDSSVYATLYESRPYPHITIEKIECTNHLLRNFCNKLKEVANKTSLGPKSLRNVVGKNVLRLRTAVTKAVQYRKNSDHTSTTQVADLTMDIINSPSHVFGEHAKCREISYFCEGPKEKERNYVPELKDTGIYAEVMKIVGSLSDHGRSLLLKMNNNPAEHYNAIVAKFIGGKRVNFALKRSYKARCFAAVVSHNSRLPLYKLHKSMYQRSPGKILKTHQLKRKREMERRALRRSMDPNKRRKTENSKINKSKSEGVKHYGEASMKPDLSTDVYNIKKTLFLSSLQRTEEQRSQLERGTLLQAGSGRWKEERRKLLTASNFGVVCKRRKTTSCEGLVKQLLYRDVETPPMFYGKNNEMLAVKAFEEKTGLQVNRCGLFVDKEIPYLGATPDGLVGNDSIVEVKCPASCKNVTPEEGIISRQFTFWDTTNNRTEVGGVNKNHNHFFQVQGQLHVTRRKLCYFVMWTPHGIRVEMIERDDNFWESSMVEKLKMFYMDCLLPELIDPRQTRSMPIRNPHYITEAINEANELKKKKRATGKQ